MKKIHLIFILLICSSLHGQNVKLVLKDTFKYKDFIFYNKVYSYQNNEFANKRKAVVGPYDFVLKTTLDQIKKTIYRRDDDRIGTNYDQTFSKYCQRIVDSSASNGFIELEQELRVTNAYFDFITIGHNIYEFAGGAHPNHYHSHFVVDLNDGKRLTFSDVFQFSKRNQVKSILSAKFNSSYGKDNLLDQFEIAENFSIDKDGIHFLYNPYEITPYAVGDPEITISFAQALPYFTTNFKSLVLSHLKTAKPTIKRKK